ncbi:hypothetical protein [Rummeliibacillus pycnus]|uniref:hypothetical protein n=1 Tax=Rummeliibacillus pycnus TaxID=101070 RepID=UPI000C99A670|nr:hypothetical protein [Rummeliibacillus pycnus]
MEITAIATIKTNEGTKSTLDLDIPLLIDLVPARKFKVTQVLESLGHSDVEVESENMEVFNAKSTVNGKKQETTIEFGYALRHGDRLFVLNELHDLIKK